jgi:hypothetical protein
MAAAAAEVKQQAETEADHQSLAAAAIPGSSGPELAMQHSMPIHRQGYMQNMIKCVSNDQPIQADALILPNRDSQRAQLFAIVSALHQSMPNR